MTPFQAIVLGLVQGLTEFLPVSSSGHLVLFGNAIGFDNSDSVLFYVLLHFATLLAVLVYFRKEIVTLRQKELLVLVIGTIPAVLAGLTLKSQIESLFVFPLLVGMALIITGAINIFADKMIKKAKAKDRDNGFPRWQQALIVGIAQAVAIIPGISRSGSTVAMGLFQGLTKERAFSFSFLLSVPAIFGATILELSQVVSGGTNLNLQISEIMGIVTAFVVGLASLKVFSYVIAKAKLRWFGFYTIALGLLSSAYFSTTIIFYLQR